MKILITGGAGFIGSNIVDSYLSLGHQVHIVDNLSTGRPENINKNAKFFNVDIRDDKIFDVFEKGKYDILNHHAAQMNVRVSVEDPKFDADNNIMGAINLYEASRKFGVKKIIFSSSGGTVYGEQEYFPADEKHPKNPCSPYGISKLTNEYLIKYYKEVCGIDFAIFRYANIYGPRQNPFGEAGVVAIFAQKMLKKEVPIINGDGKNTRDYVFVDDVVKANVLALDDNFSGIFNISTGVENDVNYIFDTLKELTGSNCERNHGQAKKGEQIRSLCSFDKIKDYCNWKPEVDFFEGLSKTVEYFKNL